MDIKTIEIKSVEKSFHRRADYDGVRHVKELPRLSVVQAVEGRYLFGVAGGPLQAVPAGCCFIAPALVEQEIVHYGDPRSGIMEARWVFLDVAVNRTLRLDQLFELPLIPTEEESRRLGAVMDSLFATEDLCDNMADAYRLVKLLMQLGQPRQLLHPYVQQTMDYVTRHFARELSVKDLAECLHISASRLHTVFKQELGMGPMEYLNTYRLSYACLLLEKSSLSIAQIAESCGIRDSFYFSKCFRARYGMAPSRYRKNLLGQ